MNADPPTPPPDPHHHQQSLNIFDRVSRHILQDDRGRTLRRFEPEPDRLQLQVLSPLGVPATANTRAAHPSP